MKYINHCVMCGKTWEDKAPKEYCSKACRLHITHEVFCK